MSCPSHLVRLARVSNAASPPKRAAPHGRLRLLAGAVCALQAGALLGFCGFYVWELARGGSDNPGRVVVSVILIAMFAAGLGYLAGAWWQGRSFPTTPTVVWNVLLLPVAWGLFQSGRAAAAAVLALVALAGIIATVGARTDTP